MDAISATMGLYQPVYAIFVRMAKTSSLLQQLRQQVINGPYVHPGANAVEDENGRVISLSTLDLTVSPLHWDIVDP